MSGSKRRFASRSDPEPSEPADRRNLGRQRAGRDRELEAGSRAHYEDPAHYTATYAGRIEDAAYYVVLARRIGGPVLEYGIGNGRVALPIARHGIDVVGVDASRAMLRDLAVRLEREPVEVQRRVGPVYGDMRRKRLRRRFPLVICPFNGALHLYTRKDVESFLARVREHLAPGGTFAMDLSMPQPADLARDPQKPYGAPRFRHAGKNEVVRYREHFDYDPWRQVLFVSMYFTPNGDEARTWMTPLAHRQFFPSEWEALLHYNGFRVTSIYGDFAEGPRTRESDVMVWLAKVRGKGQ